MPRYKHTGYTLIEMLIAITIIGVLVSIARPQFSMLLQKTYQVKAKSNLGYLRTGLNIYHTDTEGQWPLSGYPPGDTHYTSFGQSIYDTLVPTYMTDIHKFYLQDFNPTYNGLSVDYDNQSSFFMGMNPPKDVFIVQATASYIPLLNSPLAYNNLTGDIWISNGNLDQTGEYFYNW